MPRHPTVEENEKGVSTAVFTIVICTLFLFIVAVGIYVVVSDRLNGLDAYRVRDLRDRMNGYKNVCEENYKINSILQEWLKQQNIKPPPELTVQKKLCPAQFGGYGKIRS